MLRAPWIVLAGAFAALAGGCTFVIGIEHDYEVGSRDASGGAGGDTTASTSSTGASSTSSTTTASTTSSATTSTSSGGTVACPDPAMVSVGAFCVDATEVTNAAYAAWLAQGPSTAGQPSYCAWNTDFTPSGSWPAPATIANHPVVWVDWCDAQAFCTAAGKRLCRGPHAAGFADASKSEWMAACSNGGATVYPYGAGFAGDVCDGKGYTHPNQAIPVASAAACHGVGAPYAAIFDMSGNVSEWEDACSGASGSADVCRRRGGSYQGNSGALRCDADDGSTKRSTASADTGFRCCGG